VLPAHRIKENQRSSSQTENTNRMKNLPLTNPAYKYLEQSFKEWLDILGYAPTTVQSFPTYVREYLHYMEQQGHTSIHAIDIPIIRTYYRELTQRANQRRGGGLSNNYLNTHITALNKLLEYLRTQARVMLPPTGIPAETPNPEPVTPLTPQQIKSLYEATKTYEEETPALTLLDRAILAIYYDCGLRRNEGVNVNLSDIDFDQRLLHIRKGKGGKSRTVPFSKTTAKHLQDYRYEGRPYFARTGTQEAFLLSLRGGNRACGSTLNNRLKYMQSQTEDVSLQQINIHLHILRHSIATHLLYQGMELERVAQFLGHYSLNSTQIYTHLVEEVYGT
jgi:integrase/recombinase XerD